MIASSYENQSNYITNLDTSSIVTPGTWDKIARARSLDLMNSASSAENLEKVTNQYKFDADHVDEDAGFWTGWTENGYVGKGQNYGGAVRTAILSGSSAALKNLYIDYKIDANDISASNDVRVGNDLYVGGQSYLSDNVTVGSDLIVENNTDLKGDLAVKGSTSTEDLTVDGDLEVTGNTHITETLSVDGNGLLGRNLDVSGHTTLNSLEVQTTSSFGEIATFATTSVFRKDVYVSGNLFVEGSTSYINTDQLYIEDKSITVASGAASAEQADGAGFDIAGAGVELHYDSATDSMTLNRDLEILGTDSVRASTGSFGDIKVDSSASIEYLKVNNLSSSGDFNANTVSASFFYGDGRYLRNVSASIVSSSTYRSYINLEAGASQEVTHPFNTTDVFVQVYKWEDETFHPETGFGLETGSQGGSNYGDSFSVPSILVPDATVKITSTSSVEISYPKALNGYIVISNAGMLITGSVDVFECTTDIAEFNVPGDPPGVSSSILEFSHRLGTKNVIVSFYKYDDIEDGVHTVEPIKWEPKQVSISDKNHIKVVFGNTASISGYMVIAKAGHVVKKSQIDESWIQEHEVHYGNDGRWIADEFSADTGSYGVLGVSEYIDTPKIGNLNTGEQYYKDYYDTPLWGSYMEFTDRGIASYVRNYGETSGSTPEDYSEETALTISTASLLDGNGDLYLAGGVVTNHASFNLSDIREKHNVRTLTGSLDNIKKLRGVEFEWNKNSVPEIGTIAQEVQSIYPELTRTYRTIKGEERLAVNYDGLVGVLIEAVKELSGKVDQLSQELEQLRNK